MDRQQKCEELEKITLNDLGNFSLEFEKPTKSLEILKDNNHFAWVFPSNNGKWNEIFLNTKENYNLAEKIKERYEKALNEEINILYPNNK